MLIHSTRKGYAGSKKRTNLSLDEALVRAAMKYFPKTKHGSLSGFVENKMRELFRRSAAEMKTAGIKLPADIFLK